MIPKFFMDNLIAIMYVYLMSSDRCFYTLHKKEIYCRPATTFLIYLTIMALKIRLVDWVTTTKKNDSQTEELTPFGVLSLWDIGVSLREIYSRCNWEYLV